MFRILLSALVATLFSSAILPAFSTAQAAPAKNWATTVTQLPDGAFVIGNPASKTRLVEYVSYTCPHCAHFVSEATAPLKSQWIAKGVLALEIRNMVRDRFDLTAALLAHCGGVGRYAGNHEAIFANQSAWIEKASAFRSALPAGASHEALMQEIADKTGLIALMQKRGVTPTQSKSCIANSTVSDKLIAMTKDGIENKGITGTPSFLINGKLAGDAHDWASLRPLLPAPAK